MRWLSDNVLAKLQTGLAAPLESDLDPETEVDLHLKGQVFGDRFAIDRWLGSGGMGTVYRAVDQATGEAAVVKLIHPSFVGRDGKGAALAVLKEATALGAVLKHGAASPHVVKLLGTGTVVTDFLPGEALELPWIALEFVDGGADGSNLEERVAHTLHTTGVAFGPERAARAIAGIAAGLDAVHAASVVHRDVKPANVLCAGPTSSEIMKLADFGVSRPVGLTGTFGGLLVGTPGYAPPELIAVASGEIGPWTDVFGFAALAFFLLGGDHFFPPTSIQDALRSIRKPERRRVAEARFVCEELRENEAACRAIDEALREATRLDGHQRTQTASELGRVLVAALKSVAPLSRRAATPALAVHQPDPPASAALRAAFDPRGRCLVATHAGLFVGDRTGFGNEPIPGSTSLPTVRFIEALGPGRWFVGGDSSSYAVCTEDAVEGAARGADSTVRFDHFSGDWGDLCVLVGARDGAGAPGALYALAGRHWLKPLALVDPASPRPPKLAGVARIDENRWLLVGRDGEDRAYAAVYAPLAWEATRIAGVDGAPLVACASSRVAGVAIAVASDGSVFTLRKSRTERTQLEPAVAPMAAHVAHVEPSGRAWIGGPGRLWTRAPGEPAFTLVHEIDGATAFVAVSTCPSGVVAIARDFAIVVAA